MKIKQFLLDFIRKMDDLFYDNVGPIRVLFVIQNTLGMACLLPIIKEIQKRKNIKIAITDEFVGCFDWPADGELLELYQEYFIPERVSTSKKWHYVFTTDRSYLWFKRNTTVVFTHHGNAYGNLDYKKNDLSMPYIQNLILTAGHSIYFCNAHGDYNEMLSYMPDKKIKHSKQFFISGLARNDKLVNSSRKIGISYLKELGRDPGLKTIVISSHWSPKSLFLSQGSKFIESICASCGNNYNVLVAGHGNLWRDNKLLFLAFKEIEEKYENMRFLPDLKDMTALLRSGDLFIGDNSSIFVEYCQMDKPILFFDHPEFVFSDPEVGQLFKNAATSFSSDENIFSLITESLTHPNKRKLERKLVADHFLYRKGRSAEYIVDTIERIGRVSGPKSSKWNRVIRLSNSESM